MNKFDAKIPQGPLADKWTNYKNNQKLVNPANKRRLDIIVVGTGLAGASAAASLGELGFKVHNFCIQDSPRRAHSIAAQGGINAAKNYTNDGDSVYRLFYDTIKGGDYRAREANVYRLAEVSNSIIDQSQGLVTLNAGSQAVTHFSHVLAHNRDGASVGDDILLGQPTYRDVLGRLAPESLGVDYSQAGGGTDFDGLPRDVDTLDWSDQYGPRDLGAFESQVIVLDRIFASGFERP